MKRFPSSHLFSAELFPLFKKHFELCKVKKGEIVVIFKDAEFNEQYPAAALAAARELGAEVLVMTVPTDTTTQALNSNKAIVNCWKSADMVIGMTSKVHWLYSDVHNEANNAGARTLMLGAPVEELIRLFPTEEVKRRSLNGAKLLTKGKIIRITSDAGTDLTMSKEGRPGSDQYGYTDTPGRWDHWPGGLVACAPLEGSVEGTMVINTGDILLPLGRYVQSPIKLTIREGKIVKFEGGFDSNLLKDFFEAAKEKNAYQVSHIGWGTHHMARWDAMMLRFWEGGGAMDSECYLGNMQIAFGSNFMKLMKGKNVCKFHFDIPTRNHSFYLDNQLIVDKGVIVPPDLK
ncbi:MAG: hypothetical protein A2163_10470 [Actinobacteria bacterium RBG_13_35_12]|uniref:Leucyl aminopeptidase n=1 Tax=Candidatus Sediminicultor quintus TaxID=1797291 RepID=A0A1F5A7Y8_9BACT|nr:MAG: hypothetical protein A2163_10470 [Actinobacteria bacterium RBG_13_35_12]OGD13924.1 MAG: hypothetical protein A2V47_03775 [Candidatus Atribacteria bacterium RBG_19FT_COMBO_35_14]